MFVKKYAALFSVWLLLCAALIALRSVPLVTGELGDTDDYLRMVRVFQLLDGRTLDSYLVNRMGVAGGGEVAWTPLLDYVLAGLVQTGSFFTDRYHAALWVATLYPLFLLLIFIGAVVWYVRQAGDPVMARRSLPLMAVMWVLLFQFAPGRVDHHNLQAIILALGCGFLIRLYSQDSYRSAAASLAVLMALAWSIGAEAIPWVGLMAASLGLLWLWQGEEKYLKAAYIFSLGLLCATMILLPVTRGFEGFVKLECDGISLSYLAYAGAAFGFWQIIYLLPARWRARTKIRWISAIALGGGLGTVLLAFTGGCLTDPYSVTDPWLRETWLAEVNEARPALSYWSTKPALVILSPGILLLALCVNVIAIKQDKARRPLWGIFAVLLACACAMTLWQLRVGFLGLVVALFPLSWGWLQAEKKARHYIHHSYRQRSRAQRLTFAGSLFAVGGFLFFLALNMSAPNGSSFSSSSELRGASSCDLQQAAAALNRFPETQTVAAFVFNGGELMFRTPHRLLAASYHRSAEGIIAAHRLLSAPTPEEAMRWARDYDVDLILVCQDREKYWLRTGGEESFALRLMAGGVPAWLSEIEQNEKAGFRLFEVLL